MSQTHEDPTLEAADPVAADLADESVDQAETGVETDTGSAAATSEEPDQERASESVVDEATIEADSIFAATDEADAVVMAEDDTDGAGDDALDTDDDSADEGDVDEDAADGATGSTRRSRRAPSRDLLEKEGEIAADFLETLLDICDLDGDLDVDIDGDRAAVSIVDSEEGRVPRRLVGSDGKVLDALQELTRLAVYASTGERSRLILDIAGHRAERRSTLVEQAQTAIAAVKETGERQALTPMSAFERKIVHDEVLAAGLHSESDGVEPRRFVVVLPA